MNDRPIYELVKYTIFCTWVTACLWITATQFDETEWKAIGAIVLGFGGGKALEMIAKAKGILGK